MADKFTFFPLFPQELRLKIWRAALPLFPRILRITDKSFSRGPDYVIEWEAVLHDSGPHAGHRIPESPTFLYIKSTAITTLLAVNQESRYELLPFYKPVFAPSTLSQPSQRTSSSLLINLSIDCIFFDFEYTDFILRACNRDTQATLKRLFSTLFGKSEEKVRNELPRLAANYDFWTRLVQADSTDYRHQGESDYTYQTLEEFPGLKELLVVVRNVQTHYDFVGFKDHSATSEKRQELAHWLEARMREKPGCEEAVARTVVPVEVYTKHKALVAAILKSKAIGRSAIDVVKGIGESKFS